MAYTPFFQGTEAQNVINSFLCSSVNATTPMLPADMNANNVFRNPYSPEGFYANDTDMYPVSTYKPPVIDNEGIPNCEEGYLYDEVLKACRFVGFSEPAQEQSNREETDNRTESQKMYDEMKKHTSIPFGAEKFIEKYKIGEDENGNAIYNFDPNVGSGFGALKFIDMLFSGGKNREEKYNTAINTLLNQTKSNFFPDSNPLAFGNQSGDLFTMYSPQNYLNQVGDVKIPGSNQNATMNQLLATVGQGTQGTGQGYVAPTQQVNSGQQGTQVSNTSGSSLFNNGVFNPVAQQAQIAQNIATNLSNTDPTTGSPHSTNSTGSGFSTSLGGFYKGR